MSYMMFKDVIGLKYATILMTRQQLDNLSNLCFAIDQFFCNTCSDTSSIKYNIFTLNNTNNINNCLKKLTQ